MEGEQKPIIVVDESRLDLVLHLVGLAAELRAVVRDFNRLASLICTFKGNLAGLGLPLPLVRSFEESGDINTPGVADRFDLVIGIETVGLGDLFNDWVALLRPGICRKEKHCEDQSTDDRYTVRICHTSLLDELKEYVRDDGVRFKDT